MPNNFLSSGVYGCVYHPPYDCEGKAEMDKKYVSKIVKSDFTAKTEYDVGKLLKDYMGKLHKLDVVVKRKELEDILIKSGFITVVKTCSIERRHLSRSKMLPNCKLFDKDKTLEKKYVILKSKYVKSMELSDYLKKNSTQKLIMKTFFLICERINTLLSVGIIHHDLHFGNILYDGDKLYLIDFGLSMLEHKFITQNKPNFIYLKDAIFKYYPSWIYWSIDYHLLCYLVHEGKLTKSIIDYTIYNYLKHNRILKLLGNRFVERFGEVAATYFMKYEGVPIDTAIVDLLKSSSTWDLYKTALHFMEIYFTTKIELPAFKTLLMIMTHPIPEYRPVKDEMKEFNSILIGAHTFENTRTPGHFSPELSKHLKNSVKASKVYTTSRS